VKDLGGERLLVWQHVKPVSSDAPEIHKCTPIMRAVIGRPATPRTEERASGPLHRASRCCSMISDRRTRYVLWLDDVAPLRVNMGQIFPYLQLVRYGESNTITEHGSGFDANGFRPERIMSANCRLTRRSNLRRRVTWKTRARQIQAHLRQALYDKAPPRGLPAARFRCLHGGRPM
jgi:hypothetical protein